MKISFFCEECYNFIRNQIRHSYHSYRPEINYKELNEENGKFKNVVMGMELETELENNYYDDTLTNKGVRTFLTTLNTPSEELCYSSSDGSLNGGGSEYVFQPMDLKFVYSIEDKLKNGLEKLKELGWRSHNGGHCGLHIHINREAFGNDTEEQNKNINKLILFTEFYKEELIKFSRRENNHGGLRYCNFLSSLISTNFNTKYGDYKKYNLSFLDKKKYTTDRYVAINIRNSATVEMRIFRGSLEYKTIIATYEFVNNLIKVIRENPTSNIYWNKVINYGETKYLKEYCKVRDIKPNGKHLKDYTKKYEELLEKIKVENTILTSDISNTIKQVSEDLEKLIKIDIPTERDRNKLNRIIEKLQYLYQLWGYLNRGVRTTDFYSILEILTRLSSDTEYNEKVNELNKKVTTFRENERELIESECE